MKHLQNGQINAMPQFNLNSCCLNQVIFWFLGSVKHKKKHKYHTISKYVYIYYMPGRDNQKVEILMKEKKIYITL